MILSAISMSISENIVYNLNESKHRNDGTLLNCFVSEDFRWNDLSVNIELKRAN